MEISEIGTKALQVAKDTFNVDVKVKEVKKILDEDTYTEDVEKIIQRDFYPDLEKLKDQNEYLEAWANKDTETLRVLQVKYCPRRATTGAATADMPTPSTFETPDFDAPKSPTRKPEKPPEKHPTHNPFLDADKKDEKRVAVSLDKYLTKYTSEDNAAFTEIMVENERKKRLKEEWLYEKIGEQEQEKEEVLALPGVEKQAISDNAANSLRTIQSWQYTPMNALMYIPDGAAESNAEKIEKQKGKPREILHENTRFKSNPFNVSKNKETIANAASTQAIVRHGRVGADGKELLPLTSPHVNGFGFVATPSPAPGVDASPLMTWGEIESTPFRLDGNITPLTGATPGPSFKIPQVPKRDQIAFDLAEKANKAHRAKKEKAMKTVKNHLTSPSPKFGSQNSMERLKNMSPAAQRLANAKLGIRTSTDKALRASYTPSPVRRTPGSKTPTPKITPRRTPKSVRTPTSSNTTPKHAIDDPCSLTDNLLNLPKRQRAQEFF
ncbi:splicing factor ESS-2 homolog [Tubulanus polymorphus]|uniref:splicing factor ESS-2 homolog n=1 Tax=Tubulanus polymorphus TaxID=672921 RepID=UPI003DA2B396